MKTLAEKAITANNYKLHILMLDMSKAFDTVLRKELLEGLEEILLPEELHLLHILINNVKLRVRVGDEYGEDISTQIGIMQGDCLSAVLFIFYLARALTPKKKNVSQTEHDYCKPPELADVRPKEHHDHTYYIQKEQHFTITPKYADDITWATTAKHQVEHVKDTVPQLLENKNLIVNRGKTEEFEIPKPPEPNEPDWKKCKLLGSLLHTASDISRRRGLTVNSMKALQPIYKSKHISLMLKVRTFQAYGASIFLYNSELWTLTKTLEDKIDAFQRRQLRYALGIFWPRIISNDELYEITNVEPWSKTIKRRRLNWLGHLLSAR